MQVFKKRIKSPYKQSAFYEMTSPTSQDKSPIMSNEKKGSDTTTAQNSSMKKFEKEVVSQHMSNSAQIPSFNKIISKKQVKTVENSKDREQ